MRPPYQLHHEKLPFIPETFARPSKLVKNTHSTGLYNHVIDAHQILLFCAPRLSLGVARWFSQIWLMRAVSWVLKLECNQRSDQERLNLWWLRSARCTNIYVLMTCSAGRRIGTWIGTSPQHTRAHFTTYASPNRPAVISTYGSSRSSISILNVKKVVRERQWSNSNHRWGSYVISAPGCLNVESLSKPTDMGPSERKSSS